MGERPGANNNISDGRQQEQQQAGLGSGEWGGMMGQTDSDENNDGDDDGR